MEERCDSITEDIVLTGDAIHPRKTKEERFDSLTEEIVLTGDAIHPRKKRTTKHPTSPVANFLRELFL